MQQSSLQNQKKALFSHADPSYAIQQMKSISDHLHQTRDLLHESLEQLSHIKLGISNTSSNLVGTSQMYDKYQDKTKKSDLYLKELKKKQAANTRKIKMSFCFLICAVIYVFIRRIIFPGFYRWHS